MKNKRFFLCKETLSTIDLSVPTEKWDSDYEITMRDCSRQIHWLFQPTRAGLAKAKKVRDFWNTFYEGLEEDVKKKGKV